MTLWRYYQIGAGVQQPYNKVQVNTAVEIILPYNKTEQNNIERREGSSKQRADRQLCSLRFCPDPNCTCSFETNTELEEHILSGSHVYPTLTSSMDRVRSSFVQKMKLTSELHTPSAGGGSNLLDDVDIECLNLFKDEGWALPVRSTFRYTNEQKSLLHRYFMEGEISGKR